MANIIHTIINTLCPLPNLLTLIFRPLWTHTLPNLLNLQLIVTIEGSFILMNLARLLVMVAVAYELSVDNVNCNVGTLLFFFFFKNPAELADSNKTH